MTAGIAASTTSAARTTAAPPTSVQRHSSYEHALMGDKKPSEIRAAVADKSGKKRQHLLGQQTMQAFFFAKDPTRDPRPRFPDVRWIQLKASKLWVSYGEINALADYLPNPERIDNLPTNIVGPVLQRMRKGFVVTAGKRGAVEFKGEARGSGVEEFLGKGSETGVDRATAALGADRYLGLVARNACHFAPASWHRWARFHEGARLHATAHHAKAGSSSAKDIDTSAAADVRQAWIENGYADHFLQDSFAAGHLINKTLVMQWFVDWLNSLSSKWWDLLIIPLFMDNTKPWYGMPDGDVMANMGTRQQGDLAGRSMYTKRIGGATANEDWGRGTDVTDPQTAFERKTRRQRIAGSGVRPTKGRTREANYATYQKFLNSTFLQSAAGAAHDLFNKRGLYVSNARGDRFTVGGDDTLLAKSSPLGGQLAAEAAWMSRQAIADLLASGSTAHSVDKIAATFPSRVGVGGGSFLPLEDYQDKVVRKLCIDEIFPDVYDSLTTSKGGRALKPRLSGSGVEGSAGSRSAPAGPEAMMPIPTGPPGDYLEADERTRSTA